MKEVLLGIVAVVFFIIIVIEMIKESKENKKEENNNDVKKERDPMMEKLEFYRSCYGNEIPKKIYRIGEWEEEVRKDLHSVVEIKNKYKVNKEVNILIGDYNKESVSNSVAVLESMGLNVKIANSGLEIIDRLANGEKYDLIITNNIYDKGQFDGLDLLYELKGREDFNTPIIVLTVSQDKRNMFLEKGFDEYMSKLLEQEKVLETLPKVIKDLEFKKQ